MRKLRDEDELLLSVDDSGGVAIGGQIVGKLDGFRFTPDSETEDIHGRTLRAAALRGLEGELFARSKRLSESSDKDIALSEHGTLWWDGAIAGRLVASSTPLTPKVHLLADHHLRKEDQERVLRRLTEWTHSQIKRRVAPLFDLRQAADTKPGRENSLPSHSRGIAHQLCENFGSLDRAQASLPHDLRLLIRSLSRYGVWFGRRTIYLPALLRPDAASMLALLWGLWSKKEELLSPPSPGITSFEIDSTLEPGFLAASGFRIVGGRAVRFDVVERIEKELEQGVKLGTTADVLMPRFVSYLGCSNEALADVLEGLGWRTLEVALCSTGGSKVLRMGAERPIRRLMSRREERERTLSPFASLAILKPAR